MKSYLDLVKQYGRVHKKKNRITVLCIAIAVCLVTAIFGMADMEIRAQVISQIKSNGNWHMAITSISDETAKLIGSRADTAVSGWVGWIKIPKGANAFKIHSKTISVSGSEEAIAKEMGLSNVNVKGHYPEKNDEALIDKQAMEQFSISLNDSVPITFPDGHIHYFKIVGTYTDFASLKKADAHGLLLSYEGLNQAARTSTVGTADAGYYVQLKRTVNMQKSIDEIKKNYNLSDKQVSENSYLLGAEGQSHDNYMMQLYIIAAVLFVLVLAAGTLMIASSFNMNVLERIKFFGLLRCLGASKKQIKKFVFLEAMLFSLKGIPIGLAVGTGITWGACAFLKYVNPVYFSTMPLFGLSLVSIISGCTVGFLTVILSSFSPCSKAARVSPLRAVQGNISYSDAMQSKASVKTSHIKIETAMGIHHAFQSKKNILLMTCSFAMSIILFLCFNVLLNFMHQAVKPLRPYTPDVSIISADNTLSLDTNLLGKIKNNKGVKHAYGRMFCYDIPITSTQGKGKINLISYEENQFNWAKKQLVKGSIDEVQNEAGSVLAVYSDDMHLKVGDTINLKLSSGEKSVKVAGILSSCPFNSERGTQNVICSEKTFTELTGKEGYTIIDMQLVKNADDKVVSDIRKLTGPDMKFSDERQGNEETKTAFYSFAIFVYGFLAIIASITVFNIVNSMNISVSGRIGQYGMMRAVGMSGKQLHSMVASEAVTYTVCGCIAGCVLGLPLNKKLFHMAVTSHWGTSWTPPFASLLIIICISVFAALLSVVGPINKIRKMDILNVVNAE